ncbi:isochorismate synthase [Halobacteriovorax sp. HFRX-2_2]|uniref:isochorismate synthase n=1 Tax=unclassified Halobacteriovorax TaxID=2639665 RepID=UPI00371A698B
MRLSANNLQIDIINALIKLDCSSEDLIKGSEYSLYKFEAGFNNISSIIDHFQTFKKFYFLNKDKDTEILALGSWRDFNSLYHYEDIERLIESHDFLKICGAQRFKAEADSLEWHGLEDCSYFVPKVLIESTPQGVDINVILPNSFFADEQNKKQALHELAITLDPNPKHTLSDYNHITKNVSETSKSQWNKIVKAAVSKINRSQISKIVLSRKLKVSFKNPISSYGQFKTLKENNSHNSYNILFQFSPHQCFYSVTPETLFKLDGRKIFIDSLAGTTKRGVNKQEDDALEQTLLTNTKELEEHRHVSSYIEDTLASLASDIEITKKEQILKLKYIQHIHTKYEAILNENAKRSDLITHLHPTPAVAGLPKPLAMDLISELETNSRGLYAAPIGYFSKDRTEFAVGLRCALVDKTDLHIYAGCGIVKDSSAEKEWNETTNKMKNFTEVIKAKSWTNFQ